MAIEYRVDINGSLSMTVQQVARLLDRNATVAINATMSQAHRIARAPIPAGKSGIKASIGFEKALTSTKVAVIGTSHPKFKFVEEDTKPHVIKPKDKKFLRFKIGGKVIFTKKVDHPGTRGKHSFAKADAFVEAQLYAQVQNAVDAALAGREYNPLTANLISALSSLL